MTDYAPTTWLAGVTGVSPTRMNNIETGVDNAHIELQHPVTYVVAANNSTLDEKSAADYLCDGTNDEVEINNAINAAAALSATGGRIVLLGGTYIIGSTIRPKSNIILEGVGTATVIQPSVSMTTSTGLIRNYQTAAGADDINIVIRDLTLDGNRASIANTHYGVYLRYASKCTVENIKLINLNNTGIFITPATAATDTQYNHILNCYFANDTGALINCSAYYSVIDNNYMDATGNVQPGIQAGFYTLVRNNTIVNGTNNGITLGSNTICSGNVVRDCSLRGIHISGSINVVSNNQVYNITDTSLGKGIHVNFSNNNTISNNIVVGSKTHGIYIGNGINNIVTGNIVRDNGSATNNTYSQIIIISSSNRNIVRNNLVRKAAAGNLSKYGLEISAGCSNNIVVHNDLYDSGATGAILDSGTSSVITLSGNQTA